jgi:elongation factor P--beta-lysine ligase
LIQAAKNNREKMTTEERDDLLSLLSPYSRKCLRRKYRKTKKARAILYHYKPRQNLLARIAQAKNITKEQARDKLAELREWALQYPDYV